VRATVLGDPTVRSWLPARLAHARVQAEIRDQLLRSGEPVKVPDRRDDRERDRGIDAGDRHQPLDLL
jgi:hypothetical protein